MGLFARVTIDDSINLPHYPNHLERGHTWQSKTDALDGLVSYCVDDRGRLVRETQHKRQKTEEEKRKEAQKWGYDSWDEYVTAYDESDDMWPDDIDYEEGDVERPPAVRPSEQTVHETTWEDTHMHGEVEVYRAVDKWQGANPDHDDFPSTLLQYTLWFQQGKLQDVIIGGRGVGREAMLDRIREWEERFSDA